VQQLLIVLLYRTGCLFAPTFSRTCFSATLAVLYVFLNIIVYLIVSSNCFCNQSFVQAALYQTNFRPVPLEEYIKVGNTIYDKKMDIVRTLSRAADLGGKDPDHIVELCNEAGTLLFLM